MENNNYENRRNKPIHKSQFGEGGKLLPQDKELEEAVLGALMLEKDAYSIVCDILKPESFYDPANQKIFEAIRSWVCSSSLSTC